MHPIKSSSRPSPKPRYSLSQHLPPVRLSPSPSSPLCKVIWTIDIFHSSNVVLVLAATTSHPSLSVRTTPPTRNKNKPERSNNKYKACLPHSLVHVSSPHLPPSIPRPPLHLTLNLVSIFPLPLSTTTTTTPERQPRKRLNTGPLHPIPATPVLR